MADKATLADRDILADKGMGLVLLSAPMARMALNFDEWPDKDVIAKRAVIEIGRLINHHVLAAGDVADAGFTKSVHSASQIGLARICSVLVWVAERNTLSFTYCIPERS